ncbi:PaaI family thioesterase [Halalkalibacter krulwichiae]|uniref:Thioesterase domain-containing protein n=1 Tax=Halalkalibacter krulwichiae TaxID=199441 RepID=A0A1X9MCD4_9BACI|nr:PaaI family thioesterase [Halalkalibacter krulwichiae]ARK31129.1 hypothetical protein BkAM31D_15440 [Halalkalibacter krulwichiae]
MNSTTDNQLLHRLESLLKEANEEERDLVSRIVDGLELKRMGKHSTYLAALTNVESRTLENGQFEMTLPIQPLVENPLKMVHGGMTATLLDSAMGSLVNESLSENFAALTAEMNVHYIKPGVGSYLRCVASLSHKGNQLCVTEGKVYDEHNKLVAMATATFFIIKKSN